MQQTYRRAPMPKCDFNKVALQKQTSRVNKQLGKKQFELNQ